jgi:hypothetical protein
MSMATTCCCIPIDRNRCSPSRRLKSSRTRISINRCSFSPDPSRPRLLRLRLHPSIPSAAPVAPCTTAFLDAFLFLFGRHGTVVRRCEALEEEEDDDDETKRAESRTKRTQLKQLRRRQRWRIGRQRKQFIVEDSSSWRTSKNGQALLKTGGNEATHLTNRDRGLGNSVRGVWEAGQGGRGSLSRSSQINRDIDPA